MLTQIIQAIVVGVVCYVVYLLLATVLSGVFLQLSLIIIILLFCGFLLRTFGVNL